jgi:hypothetical protein
LYAAPEDYFAAMNRVEQRLDIAPSPKPEINTETQYEVVNVQERKQLLAWIDLPSLPELPQADRLLLTAEMRRELLQNVSPPAQLPIQEVMQVFEEASP